MSVSECGCLTCTRKGPRSLNVFGPIVSADDVKAMHAALQDEFHGKIVALGSRGGNSGAGDFGIVENAMRRYARDVQQQANLLTQR